jgi:hypothetical protein
MVDSPVLGALDEVGVSLEFGIILESHFLGKGLTNMVNPSDHLAVPPSGQG